MADLLIRSVNLPGGNSGDILILEGKIAEIGMGLEAPDHVRRLEGGGLLALPGAIDMHVHFRTPGGEHKETLITGARAAVKGGVTTCADMPNTSPNTDSIAALEQKMALAEGAPANMLFNFGAHPGNLDQAREAARHPAVKAIKIYMGPSTGMGGLAPDAVEAHMRQAAELGLPVMVHAEDVEMINANQQAFPHDAQHHGHLRGLEAELSAVSSALAIAKAYGVRLYLAHVTSAQVLQLSAASGLGDLAMIEVCPHHMILCTDDISEPVENRYKVNPPLRGPEERAALLGELGRSIGCLGSDHAPHTLQEKQQPYDDAPSGIPGVEYLLPFALNWWREGRISLERMIALTSSNAAAYFGLNKGELAPGKDGDVVLVDPDEQWRIGEDGDQVTSKCGWTPYAGMKLRGRPKMTVVGGLLVYPN